MATAATNKVTEFVFEWEGKDRNGRQVRGETRAAVGLAVGADSEVCGGVGHRHGLPLVVVGRHVRHPDDRCLPAWCQLTQSGYRHGGSVSITER